MDATRVVKQVFPRQQWGYGVGLTLYNDALSAPELAQSQSFRVWEADARNLSHRLHQGLSRPEDAWIQFATTQLSFFMAPLIQMTLTGGYIGRRRM